jgi:hypothetical protein
MLDEKQEQDVLANEADVIEVTVVRTEPRGAEQGPQLAVPAVPEFPAVPEVPTMHAVPAAHGLGQVFGLDPRAAILTVLVDLLLFGGDILSFGFLVVFGMFVAAALGWIVYRIQRFTYGDDHNAALTKAAIVALLTAIPVPLTPLIAVPGGIIGTLSLLKRARR